MRRQRQAEAPVEDIERALATHPIFGRFDKRSLRAVAVRCSSARFPPGATIMQQGEPGTFADVILDGEVDVFVEIPAGQILLATVGRHHIVGELGAFTDMPRTATVVAKTELFVLRIDQASLVDLVAEFPVIAFTIIGELGHRLHRLNRPLAYLTYAATALQRDEYDESMLAGLTEVPGELANFAHAFADMAAEIRQKQRRREEMLAAAEIQNSILPGPLARDGRLAAIDLYAEMRPAREIGGDFYDYFPVGDRHLAVTVADVSGKGIPAALFMAVSRTVLRSVAGRDRMAARMAEANRLLAADNAASMFATIFHGMLDLETGELDYCNAGHNPPYLLRTGGGHDTLGLTGLPFGVAPDSHYRIEHAALCPGDTLFVFSDGITEAFDMSGEAYGAVRLEAALAGVSTAPAKALIGHVLADTTAFAAGAEQSDDITCLALRWRP